MKKLLLASAVILTLTACSTGVTRKGADVRLAHPSQDLTICEYKGSVFGRNKRLSFLSSNKAHYAMNNAKNNAANLGADTLYVATGSGGSSSSVNGEAYLCGK